MGGQISFTGLNSSFDSGALIQQLVDLETQSKIFPLEIKKRELEIERDFVGSISSTLGTVSSVIDFDDIIRGREPLSPRAITTTDTDNEFISVTTTDIAVPQSFDLEILQLATNTIRKSTNPLSLGITTATQLTDLNLKTGNNINTGSVTIDGETLTYTEAGRTVLKSASALTPPADITETSILNDANFAGGVTLANGDITINGDTQTFGLDPAVATVQDLLDFFEGFSGVTEASLSGGRIRLVGVNSMAEGTSNLVAAIGFDVSDIDSSGFQGSQNITEHTLADWGITSTTLNINGVDIDFADDVGTDPPELVFDPNIETMNSLIQAINRTSGSDAGDALDLTASYNSTDNEFILTNNVASANNITVTTDGNLITQLQLTDETVGTDNSIQNVLTFLESFASVTSATLVNGKVQLDGTFQSIGSPGDSSNMINALGFNNAKIDTVGGTVTGVQNLDAPRGSALLADIGVTGTTLTINGADVTFDPATDTINDLITSINNTASTRISAFYDSLNGEIVMTNEDTGTLSMTISSADSNIATIFSIDTGASETLGNNAEFTISTLNNGQTLVANDNKIQGLMDGVEIDITKVTTEPIKITIAEDSSGYVEKVETILSEVSALISRLDLQNDSFSRNLKNRIKNVMGSIPGDFTNDAFASLINVGLESELDSDGRFLGYKLDKEAFEEAYDSAPDELNKLLWGNDDVDSEFSLLSTGNQGVFAALEALLDSYTSSTDGVIKSIRDSISTQIRTQDDRISRAEESIENLRNRLTREFSQLDVINSEFQQQQAALASSGLLG